MKIRIEITADKGREILSPVPDVSASKIEHISLDTDFGENPESGTYDISLMDRDNRLIYRVSLTLSASAECALRNERLQSSLAFRPYGTGTSEISDSETCNSRKQRDKYRSLIRAFQKCETDGKVRVADMAELMRVSRRTLKRYVAEFPETFMREYGVVTMIREETSEN